MLQEPAYITIEALISLPALTHSIYVSQLYCFMMGTACTREEGILRLGREGRRRGSDNLAIDQLGITD